MELYVETFAIRPLIEDVVQTIETMARKNGNTMKVECADDIGHDESGSERRAAGAPQSRKQRKQVH